LRVSWSKSRLGCNSGFSGFSAPCQETSKKELVGGEMGGFCLVAHGPF